MTLMHASKVFGEETCNISTFRVTGASEVFVLACRCGDNQEYIGRSTLELDAHTPNTRAQEALTVGCIEKQKGAMARACQHGRVAFQSSASEVLKKCLSRRPQNPSKRGRKRLFYRTDACATDFRELDVPRLEALLVCSCPQRSGYAISPAVTQFFTTTSPLGGDAEQKFLLECTKAALLELDTTCRNHPRRFNLESAQAFNVCCKRARVKFDDAKLKCQAVVPDDVTKIALSLQG